MIKKIKIEKFEVREGYKMAFITVDGIPIGDITPQTKDVGDKWHARAHWYPDERKTSKEMVTGYCVSLSTKSKFCNWPHQISYSDEFHVLLYGSPTKALAAAKKAARVKIKWASGHRAM